MSIDSLVLKEFSLEIYNVLGEKVFYKEKLLSNSIDVSFLEKGIYLMKLIKGNNFKTIKLIKQ